MTSVVANLPEGPQFKIAWGPENENSPLLMKRHRCKSWQIFGGAKDFCPNFPKIARKHSKENDLQKNDCISFHFGRIFSNRSTSSTIFVQISHNLPEKTKEKHDLQKNIKKCLHFDFGRHFGKIKAHKAILRWFSQIWNGTRMACCGSASTH